MDHSLWLVASCKSGFIWCSEAQWPGHDSGQGQVFFSPPPNSAAPHSNNFFCKYDLEEITLFGPNQHPALLHQQNILVQLSLGSFFAFPDGWIHFGAGNHVLSTKTNVSSCHCCPHLFFPCCPLFYSPHCCPAMCALFSRILACSLFSFYFVGLKKWNEAWT